jgi:hypothetical protein
MSARSRLTSAVERLCDLAVKGVAQVIKRHRQLAHQTFEIVALGLNVGRVAASS